MKPLFAIVLLLFVTSCTDDQNGGISKPSPVELTADAVSHYCQMNVLEHPGPKAQIHVAGMLAPLFFSQVRDAIAFIKSEERPGEVMAVYVSDMAKAPSWDEPGKNNWIDAESAYLVVGSNKKGGMGAPEIAPFGTGEAAARFAENYGGEVMTLEGIPKDAVLGSVNLFDEGAQR